MKKIALISLSLMLALTMSAQENIISSLGIAKSHETLRQQNCPIDMPIDVENIEWQRDVYRELHLMKDENAGLYSPAEPTENQKGLFTTLFNLAITKKISVYRYNIDNNEVFNETTRADIRNILTNQNIYFQEQNGNIFVDKSDNPAQQVTIYYIKEGIYYDITNSTFHAKVLAICPVLIQEEENGIKRYPLFWVLYKDLEPYIKSLPVIPNYGNKAMVMPMTDYFTLNKYKGDIYKVSNPFGQTLRQTVDSDSAYTVEQQREELELKLIRNNTYNTYYGKKNKESETQKPHRNLFSRLFKKNK